MVTRTTDASPAIPHDIRNWIKKVAEVKPREVHLGTVAARKGGPKPCSSSRLEAIAAKRPDGLDAAARVPYRELAAELGELAERTRDGCRDHSPVAATSDNKRFITQIRIVPLFN